MTRETKLGLAVALAFLALVGGVLGVKLMQGDGPPTGDHSQPAAAGSPAANPPETATNSPPSTNSVAASPAPVAPVFAPPLTNPVVPTGATTTTAADEPKPVSALKPDPDAETIKITGSGAPPAPTALPAPIMPSTTPQVTVPETPPVVQPPAPLPDTNPKPTTEAPKPEDPFAEPPPGPKPAPVPPLEAPKPEQPEVRNEKPRPAPIVLPSGGSVGDAGSSPTTSGAAPLTAPPPGMAPPVTGFNEANSGNVTAATPTRPESPGAGLSDAGTVVQPPPIIGRSIPPVGGTNETAAGSMAPAIVTQAPPAPTPAGVSPPNSVSFEKAAGSTGALISPPGQNNSTLTAPRSPETPAFRAAPAPSVRIEPSDGWRGAEGNVAAVGLAAPSGASGIIVQAPPAAGPPPLVKPVAPGGPKAQSYLVEEYRLQAGDSFEKVSQKYYFSPKYAAALQRYNQNEPLASPGLRANPPMLSVGQVVWVPPVRILERDHGDMISGLQPIPADRAAPGVPTGVRPVTPTGPVTYKVRARGESLREIARHTLNDSNRWAQIWDLNRNVKQQPETPLAPGTILRLPPEAKVDAADRP